MGISVKTKSPGPRYEDIGLDARTQTVQSIRDCYEQVTDGRFEPAIFDANIQTDIELMEQYF